jgi:hypothetical protein
MSVKSTTQLKSLETFFYSLNFWNNSEMYVSTINNMPWLKRVGAPISEMISGYKVGLPFPEKVELEELHSDGNLPNIDLSNLKSVSFSGELKNFRSLTALKKLTALAVKNVKTSQLYALLEVVGLRLTYLKIISAVSVDVCKVFHFCPNLVTLEGEINISMDIASPLSLGKLSIRRLVKFDMDFQHRKAPLGLLGIILDAPLLEVLKLTDIRLRPEDFWVNPKALTGKLKYLKDFCIHSYHENTESDEFLGKMVKCIVGCAPYLEKSEVKCYNLDYYNRSYHRYEPKFCELFESRIDVKYFLSLLE